MAEAQFHISTLGVVLAVLFVVSMGGLLWWMLHPPPPIGAAVARAVRGVSAARRILVPAKGTSYSDRAVELACRLGQEQEADIVLVYVIEVPLALPLGTPLERDEAKAREALERGSQIVRLHELRPVPIVRRDRDVAHGVLAVANDEGADLVVLGINPRRITAGDSMGKSIEAILKKSGIEVIVDLVPETA
ncbi:MAG: universal stress protein [Acidobacteria bacterium]|nr:universal stress protein [Acidobacteriota bacterium]